MEKQRLESMMIDYIDDRLNDLDRQRVEEELARNEEARKIYAELKAVILAMENSEEIEPPATLRSGFDDALRKEVRDQSRSKSIFFRPAFYRVAAAIALMLMSGAIGFWINRNHAEQEKLAEIERQMEVTRQQLAETKAMMLGMIGNDQSASQRLKGVNVAFGMPKADEEIVGVLFTTLHTDPNTNVRLAALDALAKFQHEPAVKRRLIQSLSTQSDPMVQIRLIQLMVQMKERGVVDELQKMVNDAGTMKAVKDEAYSGILRLS